MITPEEKLRQLSRRDNREAKRTKFNRSRKREKERSTETANENLRRFRKTTLKENTE